MADTLIMSRPGANNNVTGTWERETANFQKVFAGEVLTAFDETNIMKDLHQVRTIDHGKAAEFPVLGKATARYHTPGTAILGSNQIANSVRTINVDSLLISDVAIYDLEDAMNHYDVRQEYSKQLGAALARSFDQTTLRVAVLAARASGIIADEPGGHSIVNAAIATDGSVLANAMFQCAQIWDENDVTEWDRNVILKPAQYYLLNKTLDVLNRDWDGSGSYSKGKVDWIAGLHILKSNNVPSTNIAAATDGEHNTYFGDFSTTVGVALQRAAIGTVKLKDLAVQQSGADFNVMYQATLMVAKYAMGHGILRPACAIELKSA